MEYSGENVARHVSPDGELVWRVQRDRSPDGSDDYTAGFDGFLWHLHAGDLKRRGEPLAKLLAVTDELLSDRLIIVKETWPTAATQEVAGLRYSLLVDLDLDLQVKANDEEWALRFWSGRTIDIDDLINGKVPFLPLDLSYFSA